MFSRYRRLPPWLPAAALVALAGCHRYLVETPNLLRRAEWRAAIDAAPAAHRTPDIEVLYATDRAIEATDASGPKYGYRRTKWLAFGTAVVGLEPRPTWEQLRDDSFTPRRKQAYKLRLAQVREEGRFGFVVDCLRPGDSGLEVDPKAYDDFQREIARFHALLRERLERSPQKDVYIFIHGFNTSFDNAVFRPAEVWHFLGRVGVPVAYTWPAGFSGLRGYAYDRESGEFTIFHLKNFIRTVALCPDVHRIHLIAHSRGTDVTITALRELHIEYQAKGEDTKTALKIENLVLAAPDLDEDVFMQRFAAENLLAAAARTTIYASRRDRAIEAADYLFASRRRLGALGVSDFSPALREMLARLPNLQFIECNIKAPSILASHDYVFSNAAALSDLILVLRER
ncbi:MAG: alpha/beta hydrolase, partial [Gemmataceae bacterium]|nr:alpha/beta hydrolase [Gemmataceae bacterium]